MIETSNLPAAESSLPPNNFERLTRQLNRGRGQFALLFVRWNHGGDENPFVAQLGAACGDMRILKLEVSDVPYDLFFNAVIEAQNSESNPEAIFVFGLERAFPDFIHATEDDRPPILSLLNFQRELLRYKLRGPLVLWLPEHVLNLIAKGAPDFWSWRSGVFEFELPGGRGNSLVNEIIQSTSGPIPIATTEVQPKIDQLLKVWSDIHSPHDGVPRREWETAANIADELVLLYSRRGLFGETEKWRDEAICHLHQLQEMDSNASERSARFANREGQLWHTRPIGNKAENLWKAIACFEDALRVYTETDFPSEWAKAHDNLGIAWSELPTGDRADNLRKAINYFQSALRIRTETDFPEDWARTLNHLGTAWWSLPTGDRADNLRTAINCYQAALRIYTERNYPSGWAMTQSNLGIAWRSFPVGNRADNLHTAIDCYQAALRVYNEVDFPSFWARTQNNLGVTWSNLPTKDLVDTLGKAIDCYEAALRVYTEADFPSDWAMTQNNLGNTWAALPTHTPKRNLRKAIACYEAAERGYLLCGLESEAAHVHKVAGDMREFL